MLTQARFVHGAANTAKRIEPPLSALTLVAEVPYGLLDQFIGAPIAAAREFLLELFARSAGNVTSIVEASFHFAPLLAFRSTSDVEVIRDYWKPAGNGGSLVLRRPLHSIDNQELAGAFRRLQVEPEFSYRGLDRRNKRGIGRLRRRVA